MEWSNKDVQIQMASQLNEQSSREDLPSLLIQVPSRTIAGFDCVGRDAISSAALNEQNNKDTVISIQAPATPPAAASVPAYDDTQMPYSLSLSMPASPSGLHSSQCMTASDPKPVGQVEVQYVPPRLLKQTRFHSQPILHASQLINGGARRVDSARDKRFDPFKTFSGRLERQLSNLRGRPLDPMDLESQDSNIISEETDRDQVPGTDRYFDALEGPELDTLRVYRESGVIQSVRHTFRFSRLNKSWLCFIFLTTYVPCRLARYRWYRVTSCGRSCCGSRSAHSGWSLA